MAVSGARGKRALAGVVLTRIVAASGAGASVSAAGGEAAVRVEGIAAAVRVCEADCELAAILTDVAALA
jgi:hypothetical protein